MVHPAQVPIETVTLAEAPMPPPPLPPALPLPPELSPELPVSPPELPPELPRAAAAQAVEVIADVSAGANADETMVLPAVKGLEPPAPRASSFTRPEPRPRTGAHARVAASSASGLSSGAVGASGARPPTRPSALRPGPLSARGERPGALEWKPATPFVAGPYLLEVESELGAYGVTFAGRDRQSAEPVQVLVLHPAFFSAMRRATNLESLERATRYAHPEVAPVLATGEIGPTRWVATRPVGGMPLTHWRRDLGAMPLIETLRVVARLMEAVEAIHGAHGVHGGLSPETIRFYPASDAETGARADRLLIVHPFWLDACDVPPAELRPARTAWLAPELVFGEPAGPAADVYGVGLVLGYLLACGMTEPGHSLLVQGIDVPPGLDDVYVVASSRHPEHRFESIAALREALAVAVGPEWAEALERSRHGAQTREPQKPLRAEILEVDGPDDAPLSEVTDEDYAPVFASLGDTDTDERTDTALPAFDVPDEDPRDEDPDGVAVTQISWAAQAAVIAPTTGRGKRVVVPTLPHGQRSGLPVAELAPPALSIAAVANEPVEVAKTSDTLVRVKAPASRVSGRPPAPGGPELAGFAPPPLPPQAVPVEPTEILDYSSSLEALDLGPSALTQAVMLPPLPPPSHELGEGAPFGAGPGVDPEVEAESTLVEPVAPALLEKYEDDAARVAASLIGPEPTLLSATAVSASRAPSLVGGGKRAADADDSDALQAASLTALVQAASVVPEVASPISGLIAAPNAPRSEHLPSGILAGTPASAPPAHGASVAGVAGATQAPAIDPRTSRDASGALAGATVVHSGAHALSSGARDIAIGPASRELSRPGLGAPRAAAPTLGDMHGGPLSGHIARPVERNRGWILWALLALVVGGVIAYFAFGSETNKPENVAVTPAPDVDGAGVVPVAEADVAPSAEVGSPADAAMADAGMADAALVAVADVGPEDLAGAEVGGQDAAVAQLDAVADTAVAPAADTVVAQVADTAVADTAVAQVVDTAVADTAVAAAPDKTDAVVAMPEIVSDPDKLKCPDGMSKLKRKVQVEAPGGQKLDSWEVACIDRFEYPGAGASPSVGLDISGARAACASRGKRLCTRSEWRRACGGTYPYGKDYDPERCNTAGADGTPKPIAAAGSRKGCMSPSGAFDMVGNVAEWTSDGFINGGTSLRNSDDATCGSASRRAGGAPHVGFRCCADAK